MYTVSHPFPNKSYTNTNQILTVSPPGAPIFHVNGDDPEAVVRACRLAGDFRAEWGQDVVINLVCYRRLGHNEQDDPSITLPLLSERIQRQRRVSELVTFFLYLHEQLE